VILLRRKDSKYHTSEHRGPRRVDRESSAFRSFVEQGRSRTCGPRSDPVLGRRVAQSFGHGRIHAEAQHLRQVLCAPHAGDSPEDWVLGRDHPDKGSTEGQVHQPGQTASGREGGLRMKNVRLSSLALVRPSTAPVSGCLFGTLLPRPQCVPGGEASPCPTHHLAVHSTRGGFTYDMTTCGGTFSGQRRKTKNG
jgi:hypothetical protein